jgi:hypothetical protein
VIHPASETKEGERGKKVCDREREKEREDRETYGC